MHKWMKIAHDEALEGMLSDDGGPFGAVIVKSGEVIASAHNKVIQSKDPTAHAEINAIRKASAILNSFDLSECTLYTTCMPCPMCLGAIFWARIKTVYYGATEDDAAFGGFDDKAFYTMLKDKENALNMQQIDHKENAALFTLWNKKSNKTMY